VIATDPLLIKAAAIASRLLGSKIDGIEHVAAGGNSRIYNVRTDNQSFALKQYPTLQHDVRDRFQVELDSLRFMERYGIERVPRVVAASREEGLLLLTWINGEPLQSITREDIDAASDFLTEIHQLRQTPEAQCLPLASEACLCGAEIERQIRMRMTRLSERRSSEPDLAVFLDTAFIAAFDQMLPAAVERLSRAGIAYNRALAKHHQSLIPADFGFHNALRQRNGRLAFLDFEYFGWDDPVKLTADFLLHPGMTLDTPAREHFLGAAERRYADDQEFSRRFNALFPLFGFRWVLVLLNEFLPERWELRVRAGAGETNDWTKAKGRQLGRAADLLERILHETQES